MRTKGKKFRFIREKRLLPNGRSTELELIDHPGAALIVPFLSAKKILFLRQYRPVFKRHIYELPAGTLEKGERPLSCAKRELIEETGYSAKKMIRMGKIFPVPGYSTEIIHIYKAHGLFPETAEKDKDEIIRIKVFERKEVHKFFKEGKIVDAKTICALAFCGWI